MRTLFITLSALMLLTACSEKQQPKAQPIVFENDAEPTDWIGDITLKAHPNAHSGQFMSIIDTINPYSCGLRKAINEISQEKLKTVTFSYWIYFKSGAAKANTVLSIDLDGKNNYWQGVPVQDKVKEYNKWIQITETFKIPDNIDTKNKISIYVWNIGKEEIFVDDLKITFE